MNKVTLSARKWSRLEDFYEDLCRELGLPDWHGRNASAMAETLLDRGDEYGLVYPVLFSIQDFDMVENSVKVRIINDINQIAEHQASFYNNIDVRFEFEGRLN